MDQLKTVRWHFYFGSEDIISVKVRLLYSDLIQKKLCTSASLSDFKANSGSFGKFKRHTVIHSLLDMAKMKV